MIKSENGKVEIKGNLPDLLFDATCVVSSVCGILRDDIGEKGAKEGLKLIVSQAQELEEERIGTKKDVPDILESMLKDIMKDVIGGAL